ncbi:hypothetical protein ACSFBM_27885 [Variovorax sp. GB1R11]|uniref:hypothetical protein n=1 Tax=Variovorax sp. GB1R11 TaxID=3443741 RepID=UPI003F48B4BF
MTRRQWVQFGAAATALPFAPMAAGESHGGLNVTLDMGTLTVARGAAILWSLDASWLVGPGRLEARRDGNDWIVSLQSAFLPATRVPADFTLRLADSPRGAVGVLRHALAASPVTFNFEKWAAGRTGLEFAPRRTVANFGPLSLSGIGRVALMPDLTLALHPKAGALTARSRALSGAVDSCSISGRLGAAWMAGDSTRSSRIDLCAEADSIAMRPPRLSNAPQFGAQPVQIQQAWLELAEDGAGTSQAVTGATHVPQLTLVQHLGQDAGRVTMRVRDATLAFNTARQQIITGRVAQTATVDRQAVLEGVLNEEFVLDSDGRRCRVNCEFEWLHAAFAHEHGVHAVLRPSVGHEAPGPRPAFEGVLDNAPWRIDRIPLDDMELEFMRPEDHLWLRYRFRGFELRRGFTELKVMRTGADARIWLVLPPQSISEEAFFRAPAQTELPVDLTADVRTENSRGIPFASQEDQKRKHGQRDDRALAASRFRDARDNGNEDIPQDRPVRARVAGESRFCFEPAAGAVREFPVRIDALLDTKRWRIVVAQSAASSLEAWRYATRSRNFPAPPSAGELAEATLLEIPWRLHISPSERTFVDHGPVALHAGEFHPVFQLKPRDPDATALQLRAIHSPDHSESDSPPLHYGSTASGPEVEDRRQSLDENDRFQLVDLTGRWGRQALLGSDQVRLTPGLDCDPPRFGIFEPRPFHASLFRLSALGASMRSKGLWDPPYFRGRRQRCDETDGGYALSIQAWDHSSTFSRSHFDRVVYKGYLMPYGHQAVLIKITARGAELVGGRGSVAANLQRYFIRVVKPRLDFPLPGQPPESANAFPQPASVEILLDGELQIQDPKGLQLGGFGPSAFVIRTAPGTAPHGFTVRLHRKTLATTALAFVDNTVVHASAMLRKVVDDFHLLPPDVFRQADVDGGDVQYAPSLKRGDTSWPTQVMQHEVTVNWPLVNSVLLETASQPPFYPVVAKARVVVRSIGVQTGAGAKGVDPVWVTYDNLYKRAAFEAAANGPEIYLKLLEGRPLNFKGKSDRAGGVANPDMTARGLTRKTGVVAYTGDNVSPPSQRRRQLALRQPTDVGTFRGASRLATLESNLAFDGSAKIMGAIPLSALLEPLGLEEVPKLLEELEYRVDAAGDELVQKSAKVLAAAEAGLDEVISAWNEPCAPSASGGWCASQAYKDLSTALTGLRASVVSARAAADAGNAAGLLALLPGIGKSVNGLVDKLKDIAARPEVLMQDLLLSPEFQGFASWVAQTYAASNLQGVHRVINQALAAHAEVQRLVKKANDYQVAAKELVADLRTRAYQTVAEVRSTAVTLAADLEKLAKQSAQDAIDDIAGRLLASCSSLLVRAGHLYDAYMALADQLRAAATQYPQLVAALATQVTATRDALRTQLDPAKSVWLARVGGFEQKLLRICQEPGHVEGATLLRRIEPDLRAVRDVYMAVSDTLGTNKPLDGLILINLAAEFMRHAVNAVAVAEDYASGSELGNDARTWVEERIALVTGEVEAIAGTIMTDVLANINSQLSALKAAAKNLVDAIRTDAALGQPRVVEFLDSLVQLRAQPAPLLRQPAVAALVRDELDRVLQAAGLPACAFQGGLAQCVADWGFYDDLFAAVLKVAQEIWRELKPVIARIHGVTAQAWWTNFRNSPIAKSAFGPDFAPDLEKLDRDLGTIVAVADMLDIAGLATLITQLPALTDRLKKVTSQVSATQVLKNLQSAVLDLARDKLVDLASRFVPAKIATSYTLDRDINKEYAGIFLPGVGAGTCNIPCDPYTAHLRIVTSVDADLLEGTSKFALDGELTSFSVNIFGLIKLPVGRVKFHASTTDGFHLERPEFCAPSLDGGPLKFLEGMMKLIGGGGGFFLQPVPNGIRAGFGFQKDIIQVGGMTIQNFDFEVAMLLPFDDRAAEVSCAVARRYKPMLISIGPYGGGGFFEMVMAMDRLVSISASFEFGLVGAFKLAMIEGTGRITVGLYYRQSGEGSTLEGFFYAGGEATVLGIVSISAELVVRLVYENGSARGDGRFGVRVGCGPFGWTLNYSVSHSQGGGGGGAKLTRTLAASAGEAPRGEAYDDDASLMDADIWRQYQEAFEA